MDSEVQTAILHFEYTLGPEDFLEGQRVFNSSFGSKWARFNYKGLVPVALLFIGEGIVAYFLRLGWFAVLFLPVLGCYYIMNRIWFWPWRVKREYARYPDMKAPRMMDFFENQVVTQTSHGRGEMIWSRFSKFAETPRAFVLFTPPKLFYTVPKRGIPPEKVDSLRMLLSRKITPAVGSR